MREGASARGVSIRIWLIDGTPQGMRLSEKSGWTGSCLDFARSDYVRARQRDEAGRTGLYVLVGPDPQFEGLRTRVYVGESDVVRTRLDQHQKEKDFWTRAFLFTSRGGSLNKAHVRYLEARMVGFAIQAASATVENSTVPEARGLSEAERDDMEAFLDEVLLLLPLLGVSAFSPMLMPKASRLPLEWTRDVGGNGPDAVAGKTGITGQPVVAEAESFAGADEVAGTAVSETVYFHRERGRGADAIGVDSEARETPRGFIVLEGSSGPARDNVMTRGYALLRQRLRADGILVASEPGALRMSRDYVFDSPSAAASVLAGGSRNGKTTWKDATGRTFAAHQSARAEGSPSTPVVSPDASHSPSVRHGFASGTILGGLTPVPGAAGADPDYFLQERSRAAGAVAVQAEGRDTPSGFVVLAGSTGPAEERVMTPSYELLRQRLRADGTLVAREPGVLCMSRSYAFDSPSAAATVLAGSERNGTTSWKDATGWTLAERRAEVAGGDLPTRL
jgi:Domain of unknown function (DUF4357)